MYEALNVECFDSVPRDNLEKFYNILDIFMHPNINVKA